MVTDGVTSARDSVLGYTQDAASAIDAVADCLEANAQQEDSVCSVELDLSDYGDVAVGVSPGAADQVYGIGESVDSLNAAALQSLSDQVGAPAYLLAVPTAAAVYDDLVPPGAPVGQDEKYIALAAEHAPVIPLLPELRAQRDGDALYYRTDHHWTAAGARLGYLAVCRALNLTPMAPSPLASQPGFLGSCFARCPLPWTQADLFSYEAVPGLRLVIDGEEMPALADPQGLPRRDAYAALLYGNHGLLELVNDEVEGGTLVVLKDSYANALLPALARHYHRVVAIDPRYFSGNAVETIQAYEGDAVLCVYGIASLATSRSVALLEGL